MVAVASFIFGLMESPTAVAAMLSGTLAIFFLYRWLFSPLSGIPGPWITALTGLYVMYHEFRGDRTVVIDRLHTKYGPVVRVSPTEVSFNSTDALKEIYGIKSIYSKSRFYDMFVYYNERNTFTSLHRPEHSAKKKLVADRYTKSYVMQDSVARQIQSHASKFLSQVEKSPSSLDVYTWLHYYALDCITNHLYGQRGTNTLAESTHRALVYDLSGVKHRTRLYMIFYFGALMAAADKVKALIRRLSGTSTDFHVRGSRLNDYGRESVVGFRREKDSDSISTCAKLFKAVPDNETNVNKIAAECMDHLVAAVDTAGDAMCILMWRISTAEYTHVQDRIFKELQSIEHAFDHGTAPIAELDKLPYLDAVIHESLRWRPPVPMTLFRVVPPGGASIAEYNLPQGVTVGCQAYSLHRKPDVFPDPDRFDPERWMTSDGDGDDQQRSLSAMKAHFWPFSSGGRMCLGHNLAMVEMKILMAAVYRQYTTRVVADCTEESMRMDDQLTSGVPYALSCKLSFEERSE